MSKKTKVITYNIGDRGRSKELGIDRSDIDIKSMIDRINAPVTQELINSGDMYGYYGHELRARFGMNPPDVWVNPNTGESRRIEPAIRTTKLSADNDGNVTSQHEFLDTDDGKYSERLYANNTGGFSSAVTRKMGSAGKYSITGHYGFDYVRTPNYNTNRGGGVFDALFIENEDGECAFDSLENASPERMAIMHALDTAISHQYDAIQSAVHSEMMVNHYQNEAMQAQQNFIDKQDRIDRLASRRIDHQEAVYDSLICPSKSFDSIMTQWDSFSSQGTTDRDLMTTESAKQASIKTAKRRDERVSLFHRR